ncbi:MAG: hypothetical protein ACOY4I_05685 [Bacillota bacterium]
MDQQVVQLQQQIQRLQQEINDITQVCNQLQQSEQANAIQLQQMTQKELMASQGLRRIQQVASQLSQDVTQLSNITQQIATQVLPMQRALQTTGVIPTTYASYTGLTGQLPTTGVFGGQFGAFGQGTTQLGQFPINFSAVTSQLPLYTQGYSQNALGTGGQMGYSTQAFSNPANQFGMSTQTPWSTNMFSQVSPAFQSGLGTSQQLSGIQSNLAGAGLTYSPYQSNQFGFR